VSYGKDTFSNLHGYRRTGHISCSCYVLTVNKCLIITSELVTEYIFRLVVQELARLLDMS
jgi:hypothetical protein